MTDLLKIYQDFVVDRDDPLLEPMKLSLQERKATVSLNKINRIENSFLGKLNSALSVISGLGLILVLIVMFTLQGDIGSNYAFLLVAIFGLLFGLPVITQRIEPKLYHLEHQLQVEIVGEETSDFDSSFQVLLDKWKIPEDVYNSEESGERIYYDFRWDYTSLNHLQKMIEKTLQELFVDKSDVEEGEFEGIFISYNQPTEFDLNLPSSVLESLKNYDRRYNGGIQKIFLPVYFVFMLGLLVAVPLLISDFDIETLISSFPIYSIMIGMFVVFAMRSRLYTTVWPFQKSIRITFDNVSDTNLLEYEVKLRLKHFFDEKYLNYQHHPGRNGLYFSWFKENIIMNGTNQLSISYPRTRSGLLEEIHSLLGNYLILPDVDMINTHSRKIIKRQQLQYEDPQEKANQSSNPFAMITVFGKHGKYAAVFFISIFLILYMFGNASPIYDQDYRLEMLIDEKTGEGSLDIRYNFTETGHYQFIIHAEFPDNSNHLLGGSLYIPEEIDVEFEWTTEEINLEYNAYTPTFYVSESNFALLHVYGNASWTYKVYFNAELPVLPQFGPMMHLIIFETVLIALTQVLFVSKRSEFDLFVENENDVLDKSRHFSSLMKVTIIGSVLFQVGFFAILKLLEPTVPEMITAFFTWNSDYIWIGYIWVVFYFGLFFIISLPLTGKHLETTERQGVIFAFTFLILNLLLMFSLHPTGWQYLIHSLRT